MNKLALLPLKIKISLKSSLKVLWHPAYALLVVVGAILSSGFILWSLNLGLVSYILFEAPLNFASKLDFFIDVYKGIYTTYSSVQGTLIVVFSILFGINLALLVYVFKNHGFSSIPKKSGVGGFFFAIVGGGCIACGTSLLAPILATLGATTTPLVRDLTTLFMLFGALLIIYSIYKLGSVISYVMAQKS